MMVSISPGNYFVEDAVIFQKSKSNKTDEVKLAVAPCGSSEKNCWGWEGVSITKLSNFT